MSTGGFSADTGVSSIRRHIIGSPLGSTLLTDVTPGKIDLFLSGKEKALSARSVNPRANPVADVPKRKVVKRLPDYLRPTEVPPLLASLTPKWKNLFATAIYTGMRKGELFALRSYPATTRTPEGAPGAGSAANRWEAIPRT